MTARGTRILAGSLLVSLGLSEERAEDILRAFTAADLDIVKRDPPREQTGPKAENHRSAYIEAKAAIAEARKKTSAATKPTEYEETQP